MLPIRKYACGGIPTPLDKATRNETLDGHHGSLISIHVAPTIKYILSLYLKYLERITKPTNKEIATKIRENIPFSVSIGLNDICFFFLILLV